MNNNYETEEPRGLSAHEFHDAFASAQDKSYGFKHFTKELSKQLEVKSITRKCFDQSATELQSAMTLRSETQYYFDKYTKNNSSYMDAFEDLYLDVLGDILYSEEQYVTSASKRARSMSFTCFDEMFEAIKVHKEHHCHVIGIDIWRAVASCSNMITYYVPAAKHELVMDGVLGSLVLPGSPTSSVPPTNFSAPLITDMYRLARFAILERDTWLHFETPCGIYYAEPLDVKIFNAGNRPGILVKHGFACAITDPNRVRAYHLVDNTLV